jgi:L-idonate 5-dehydrogenase
MRSVVIHAPHDLRIEALTVGEPGPGEVAVRIANGGICGSDLHYYQHGGFGVVRLKEPMILGHEVSGVVTAIGSGVTRVKTGDRVAVNPSRPCGHCRYCIEGTPNQCLDMRYYGSAMRFPHVQGAFRDAMVVHELQAFPFAPDISLEEAAFAEPFSVALHAIQQAGPLLGHKVLVTGCGPIGCLAVVAVRQSGASEIVATDIRPHALETARRLGADRVIDTRAEPDALKPYAQNKGYFDAVIECSGNAQALVGALDVVRATGRIVTVGLGGEVTVPLNTVVAKEITLRGAFRATAEFGWAVDLINSKRVDLTPLLTATFPVDKAVEAFEFAGDRAKAMKVQLSFAD